MERRGLCSVDPRHAVARLLQAMKRADAKKDEKGADCRDGEKARPVARCQAVRNAPPAVFMMT